MFNSEDRGTQTLRPYLRLIGSDPMSHHVKESITNKTLEMTGLGQSFVNFSILNFHLLPTSQNFM